MFPQAAEQLVSVQQLLLLSRTYCNKQRFMVHQGKLKVYTVITSLESILLLQNFFFGFLFYVNLFLQTQIETVPTLE